MLIIGITIIITGAVAAAMELWELSQAALVAQYLATCSVEAFSEP